MGVDHRAGECRRVVEEEWAGGEGEWDHEVEACKAGRKWEERCESFWKAKSFCISPRMMSN